MLKRYAIARVRLRNAFEYPWLYFVSDRNKALSRTYSNISTCLPNYYRNLVVNPKMSRVDRERLLEVYHRFKDACINKRFIDLEMEVFENYGEQTTITRSALRAKAFEHTRVGISQWLSINKFMRETHLKTKSIDKDTLSILENLTR